MIDKDAVDWARYCLATDEMDFQVDERIRQTRRRSRVTYSAFETDEDSVPINNLNEIAVHGRVKFRQARSEYWGGPKSRDWESPVLENPTWLDLAVQANDQIRVTRDYHHRYLETLTIIGQKGDVSIAEFLMGS